MQRQKKLLQKLEMKLCLQKSLQKQCPEKQ